MALRNREGWTIPDVIDPPESMRVSICIPKNVVHMKAFWGALWELTFWNNWEANPEHDGAKVASVWMRYWLSWERSMNELPDCEGNDMDCCTEPAITRRVNPTTGMIEQSTDGGATWTPAAGGINSYIVEPVPPVTSGVAATKCDAATNLSDQVQVWIDQVTNDFDTATTLLEFATAVLTAILAAVLTILSAGTLTAVEALVLPTIAAALTAAWGAGKAVFVAYWTTEIKDKILCDAYCNIGSDGSFTDAQFSAFWGDVNSDLPASPAKMLFMGFLSSVGRQGVNAMAASGMSADADCSDCVECITCPEKWFPRYHDPSLGVITEVGEDYIIAETTTAQPNGVYYISLWTNDENNYNNCCYINSVEILTGSPTVNIGSACGENAAAHPLLLPNCLWWIEPQSGAPFSIKIHIGECP